MKWFALAALVFFSFTVQVQASGHAFGITYPKLFSQSSEIPQGFERRAIRAGGEGFDFSTIMPVKTRVIERQPVPPSVGSVVLVVPETIEITVRHLPSPVYIDARFAARSFMRLVYDEVVLDEDAEPPMTGISNAAFALAAGVRRLDGGGYGKMARAAVVSRGDHAILILAEFQHADYDRLEPVLARLFGGIRMDVDMEINQALRMTAIEDGSRILLPAGWAVSGIDGGDGQPGGVNLTLSGSGFPAITLFRLGGDMTAARQRAETIAVDMREKLGGNSDVELSGDIARIVTPEQETGPALHLLAWDWQLKSQDMPMRSVVQIIRGHDGRIWQLVDISPDQRRFGRNADREKAGKMARWSMASGSAIAVIGRSILFDPQQVIAQHSVRRVGH